MFAQARTLEFCPAHRIGQQHSRQTKSQPNLLSVCQPTLKDEFYPRPMENKYLLSITVGF